MNDRLEQLAHAVDRELELLARLDGPDPTRAVVERLKHCVRIAAGAQGRPEWRLRGWVRNAALAAAAAVILVTAYRPVLESWSRVSPADETAALWEAVFDASSQRVLAAVSADTPDREGTLDAATQELDTWSESLEASFDRLGAL